MLQFHELLLLFGFILWKVFSNMLSMIEVHTVNIHCLDGQSSETFVITNTEADYVQAVILGSRVNRSSVLQATSYPISIWL